MKSSKVFLFQFFLLLFLIPVLFLTMVRMNTVDTTATEAEFSPQEETYTILISNGGELQEMDLEQYVLGVTLAEMPADFEPEALKAQAVVARTFAWKAAITGGKHGDSSVCTNSRCCQGYLSPEMYLRYYGTEADLEKVQTAVHSTNAVVITYQGELIEATYFSSSGGSTEDAVAVWGNSYPYLVHKDSPEPDSIGEATAAFSRAYLESALHVQLEGDPNRWFHDWVKTSSGGVANVGIGNGSFSGTELREILNLRSTVFSVKVKNDVVFFFTKGYGHRVGMSQYGAEAMAAQGNSWEEILQYYYTGVSLEKISQLQQLQPS